MKKVGFGLIVAGLVLFTCVAANANRMTRCQTFAGVTTCNSYGGGYNPSTTRCSTFAGVMTCNSY